jgi:ATP-dependent RNA helicase DHX37/DHR1
VGCMPLTVCHILTRLLCRKSQAQITSALDLQSSAMLGTGRAVTHQERLDREEDRLAHRLIDAGNRKGTRKRKRPAMAYSGAVSEGSDEDLSIEDDDSRSTPQPNSGLTRETAVVIVDSGPTASVAGSNVAASATASVGSALRKNPDGIAAAPRVVEKHKKQVCSSAIPLCSADLQAF